MAGRLLTNCLIDIPVVYAIFFGQSTRLHEPFTHSFWGALAVIALVSLYRTRSSQWLLGTWLGGFTHIGLDMLVHADMSPFYPYMGNPVYMGWMQPLSMVLLPFTAWWGLQLLNYWKGRLKP